MAVSAEHRANMFTLAQQRRREGKPTWAYRIDVSDIFHDDGRDIADKASAIAELIRGSDWYRDTVEDDQVDELAVLIDELGDVDDVDWFDAVWDAIYGLADHDRTWINTF